MLPTRSLLSYHYERSTTLAVFQGSNTEICEFLQMRTGPLPRLAIEVLRTSGHLQRDAAWFLEQLDQIEAATTNATHQAPLAALADISSEVEQNRNLVSVDKKRCNIISCNREAQFARMRQRLVVITDKKQAARPVLILRAISHEASPSPNSCGSTPIRCSPR